MMNRQQFTRLSSTAAKVFTKSSILFLALVYGNTAFASESKVLPKPTGKVILTVTGKITLKNDGDAAKFDLAMLDALTQRKTLTHNPWTRNPSDDKAPVVFEGPLLSAVFEAVGATGSEAVAVALNDYVAHVPMEDARKWPVILATRMEGKPLTIRDKGPLFIIYPFDEHPDLYNEVYFCRSAWQVKAFEIR